MYEENRDLKDIIPGFTNVDNLIVCFTFIFGFQIFLKSQNKAVD